MWRLKRERVRLAPKPTLYLAVFCFVYVVFLSCVCSAPVTEDPELEVETFDKYYNFVDMTRRLKSLAQKYQPIANLSSIGKSVEGRELWVMRISSQPRAEVPGKPGFKYVGNMHGDETVSRQVLIYLIELLLTRYGEDQRVTELVNTTDIYIMPSMNPDGFEKSVEGDCSGNAGGRNNAKNIDLNRSFPDQFNQFNVDKDDTPERTAVMQWILQNK